MATITELEREAEKTREYLKALEHKLHRARVGYVRGKDRIRRVEAELKAKYPNANPDKELLSLVGTLPKPHVGYKEALRRIVAERYAI